MHNHKDTIERIVGIAAIIALSSIRSAFGVDGWATQGGGTTGGTGGAMVTVSTLADFQTYATGSTKYIIHVSGTINLGSSSFAIGSNKTIIGDGADSGFVGNLSANNQSNLILQNLNFTNPNGAGEGDGLSFRTTTRYFVTQCTFAQCADGQFDQSHASDYGTISWCKFYYTYNGGHNFSGLIGNGDDLGAEDAGHLRITMHHNWYSTLCKERMPRVRYGLVHLYNNYYAASGNNYNIGVGVGCQILAQNNYFDGQNNPWSNYSTPGYPVGIIHYSDNYFVNCAQPTWAPNSTVFTPPYSYTPDNAGNVKSTVTAGAGAGANGGGGDTVANGTYKLIARHSGKAMEVSGGGTANGTQIQQWSYVGGASQKWIVNEVGGNLYSIMSVASGKSVDIDNWGTANGTKVQLWDYAGGSNQKFAFTATDSGNYKISPSHATGSCLDVSGISVNDGAAVQLWGWLSGQNQQWTLQSPGLDDGTYKLIARHSGKAMDAFGAQTANGTEIIQWSYGGGANQKWNVTDTGGGNYKIIGVQSGKSLDIYNGASDNGTKVELWDFWGGPMQLFQFTATDGGYYRISPNHATGSCLDVSGISTADGAAVQLWQWLNGANQQWGVQVP